jgi:transposase
VRGSDHQTGHMFSYLSPEQRIRPDHPIRGLRRVCDDALRALSPRFEQMYAATGRPSIPPEHLLRALVLQAVYSIRSERLLMEEIEHNIRYRWFIGLSLDDEVWDATVFCKNRDRLLQADVATAFFDAVVAQARTHDLLSSEHFTVDGTLLEAWAGQKSFKRKDAPPSAPPDDPGNPTVNFRGEKRANATHASTTDPDARLAKKATGQASLLAYMGHLVMENRHGLIVNACATIVTGHAERDAALQMLRELGVTDGTVGGDKGFDVRQFVDGIRELGLTPHVAQKQIGSAIDGRTTRQAGYEVSQRKRKLVEQVFGWLKTVGLLRKLRHRGEALVDWMFTFRVAAYNLVRLRNLAQQ